MPVSFILIAVILVLLLFYKKIQLLKTPKVLLFTLLVLTLIGFFIAPIAIGDSFSLNVLFAFCTLALAVELLSHVGIKKQVLVLLGCLVVVGSYYLLTQLNSDYYSFFNYVPIAILVNLLALLFMKSKNTMLGFTILSLFLLEWFNYFTFSTNIGYLNICSYDYLNVVTISCLVVGVLQSTVRVAQKQRKVKKV